MQQAGWLGHDMTHARDSSLIARTSWLIYGVINGFDRDWWSDKHNTVRCAQCRGRHIQTRSTMC